MANILQQVKTYQLSMLALLLNHNCFIGTANTRYKNFDKIATNRGNTVDFDLPPRFVANDTLTATFQDAEQRVQSLTVSEATHAAFAFTNQEFIFNAEDYMDRFGKSAIHEIGASIESNVAANTLTAYRFFGDGVNPINSYGQLASALAFFRNYGAAQHDTYGYLDDISVASIVNSGLNQFVINRNETIANSWMLGDFSNAKWCQSNLLPTHVAGAAGIAGNTLTFVSINGTGDQITMSGFGPSIIDAVKENDLMEFSTDIRYLTFIGHKPSANKVQVRITADASSNPAGQTTFNITPALVPTLGRNQNMTRPLAVTDVAKILPSHRRGLICSGKALYMAMPKLPEQTPFPTSNVMDPSTGVSLRAYYGSMFGENKQGFITDAIWGSTLVPEYSMALIFPESS